MTVKQWLEIAMGFVVPTGAVVWGVWILWRWFRPGTVRVPSRWLDAVIGFLLACILVMLIVLAWELFKSWRRPRGQRPARLQASAMEIRGQGRSRVADPPRCF